jgi:filamentous hemagglutinin
LTTASKDRRQINRATIGDGAIIIRSDPDAGLEGLNRDLARAQEIIKDSETAVSVYIDPAVLSQVIGLLGRALTSGDNGQERLAEMTGKMLVEQGLLPKEVWNAIVNWERMSSEEKGVA